MPMATTSNPVRILVAEDSPTQAEQLRHVLEQRGYEVVVAEDGVKALELLAVSKPSLVISDIVMPEMDGYELCRRIRIDKNTPDLPVILLTALADTQDVFEGLSCGADSFITKPYSGDYLLEQVARMLPDSKRTEGIGSALSVDLSWGGKNHVVVTNQKRLITLLISTYEAAVRRNTELARSQEELSLMNERLEAATVLAEAANRAKSEFIANMSHELRTPLNAILGFSDVLLDGGGGEVSEKQKRYLANIRVSGGGLLRMIGLRVEVASGLPTISADERRIAQVLINLLSNALKFTPDGGEVGVEAAVEAKTMRVTVWDTGIGIAAEDFNRIFLPFQQLESPLTKSFEGTGLGLYLCRKIVELHGGRIRVESAPGRGSRFTFTVPITAEPGESS